MTDRSLGLEVVGESGSEIAGPGLAGFVIQFLGWPMALIFDGASYIWSALWLSRISNPGQTAPATQTPAQHVFADIAFGFDLCWRHDQVRPLLLAQVFQTFAGGFFMSLYMVFTLQTLHLGEAIVGTIIGVGGIGALIGVWGLEPLKNRLGYGPATVTALALGQAAQVLVPLSGSLGSLQIPALVAHQLLADGILTIYFILSGSLRQSVLPQDALARARSAFLVVEGVSITIGALIAGALAQEVGVLIAVWTGVLVGLLAIVPLAFSTLVQMQAPETPSNSD